MKIFWQNYNKLGFAKPRARSLIVSDLRLETKRFGLGPITSYVQEVSSP